MEIKSKLHAIKLEYLFIVIYIIMGVMSSLAFPMFHIPDEPNHFLRAYEISEGHLISELKGRGAGNVLPDKLMFKGLDIRKSKWSDYSRYWNQRIDRNHPHFYNFSNISLYAPTNYIMQTAGIIVTRLFTDRTLLLAYGGRFLNWLFAGVCIFFAIRLIPRWKLLLFAIAFIPMSIHQYASLSADVPLIAVSLLYISFIFKLREQHKQLSTRQLILLYVMAWFLALTKIVYLPLVFCILLLPSRLFSSPKARYLHVAGIAGGAILLNLLWLKESSHLLAASHKSDTDPQAQTIYVLTHPYQYLKTLYHTVKIHGLRLWDTMFGSLLGWLDIKIRHRYILGYQIILLISGLASLCKLDEKESESSSLAWYERLLLLGICVGTMLLMATALYVQWTPYKKTIIDGLQGRYYLPLLLPFFISILPDRLPVKLMHKPLVSTLFVIAILIINIFVFLSPIRYELGM